MTDREKSEELILSHLDELLVKVDQQGKKIDAITKRIEKLEKPRSPGRDVRGTCEGDCYAVPADCVDALLHPDKYQPAPGEATPKEDPGQTKYKKSFWKKFE